jgi:peroxiredoxin
VLLKEELYAEEVRAAVVVSVFDELYCVVWAADGEVEEEHSTIGDKDAGI